MKKNILLMLLLLVIAACGKRSSDNNPVPKGIVTSNENIVFYVTAGNGAENVAFATVEVFDRDEKAIVVSKSNADGQVVLNIPKIYIEAEEEVDVVITKDGFGQTKLQDVYLGKVFEAGDVTLFKQPLSFVEDGELEEKGVSRAKAIAPTFGDITVSVNENSKNRTLKLTNDGIVDIEGIDKITLSVEGEYPMNSSGHKWKGIRAEVNNNVTAYSSQLDTEKTNFVKTEKGKYIYNGDVAVSYKLFPGENYIELVAQDVESNQTIKRIYFDTKKSYKSTDKRAFVAIRDYSFTTNSHNAGYYYLPYRNIERYEDDKKADVSTNRKLDMNFSVEDVATGDAMSIRGFNTYYRMLGSKNWKKLDTITYGGLKNPDWFEYPETEKNKQYNYRHISYRSYLSLYEEGKFYEFKVEVFDENKNVLGESNTVKLRPLGYFSVKAHGEYDVHGREAKQISVTDAAFSFDFLGLDELNKDYKDLKDEKKELIEERRVDMGFNIHSVGGGYANTIINRALGTGLPFVFRIDKNEKMTLEPVYSYRKDVWYDKDYGSTIPGGEYLSSFNCNDKTNNYYTYKVQVIDNKINILFNFSNYMDWYNFGKVIIDEKEDYVRNKIEKGIELGITDEFLKPGVTYEWDIVGQPVMEGYHSSQNYSPAKYVEEYKEVEVITPYPVLDENGKQKLDSKGNVIYKTYVSRGKSNIKAGSRTATPDGSYTVITE